MAAVQVSEAEKVYIMHGVRDDLRLDGRGCEDYRHMEIETDVVSNTDGSAKISLGHTDVLVGIKAEIGKPKPMVPNEGYLEFFVDWLDYCNALLAGLPSCTIKPLQMIHNAAARLVFNEPKRAHVTPLFITLHWLPIAAHIKLKKLMLAYRTTTGSASAYLHSLLPIYTPSRTLRSTSERRLIVPSLRGTKSLSRTFSYTVPGCSANATPEFEGRGGEELGVELSNTLYKVFNNRHSVDLRSLCICPGENCWVLYVDVLLLQCDGNLFDAISIAIKAALFNTRIPKVHISEDEEGVKEIELSDDPYDCMRLNVENVPCIVTLCKIGQRYVVDATLQEKACSVASLLISVTHKGMVTCVRKMGGGSLDPESIFEMTEAGKRVGKALHAPLIELLQKEESLGKKRQKVGFLG
ncbi:Exosome complex component RRP42 [Labeo rohita]|uniref:Ribosomal RNA-processing protein 42 n=1 Tax=Labeo rohita TaxID=84645 RepID=A0ABQ8LT44_LABRO|nr:Exosome complex component RRP42 [Labeo rohita]